jgi:tetratricopeptide (TPR) repeat protein/CHAT domain-containing protein
MGLLLRVSGRAVLLVVLTVLFRPGVPAADGHERAGCVPSGQTVRHELSVPAGQPRIVTFALCPEGDGPHLLKASSFLVDMEVRVSGGDGKLLREDDDTGPGTDAWVPLRLAAGETYRVEMVIFSSPVERSGVSVDVALEPVTPSNPPRVPGREAQRAYWQRARELSAERGLWPRESKALLELAILDRREADYEQSERLARAAAERAEEGGGPLAKARIKPLQEWAHALGRQGRVEEALDVVREALPVMEHHYGEGSPEAGYLWDQVGSLSRGAGRTEQALEAHRRAIRLVEAAHGPRHPSLAAPLNNYALAVKATGDYPRALELLERSLEIRRTAGASPGGLAVSVYNVARTYLSLGRTREALPLIREARSLFEQEYEQAHPQLARMAHMEAQALIEIGELEAAEEKAREAVRLAEATLDAEHALSVKARTVLGTALGRLGRTDQAREALETALVRSRILEDASGWSSGSMALVELIELELDERRYAQAVEYGKGLVRASRDRYGPDQMWTGWALGHLGRAYQAQGQAGPAIATLERALRILRGVFGGNQREIGGLQVRLAIAHWEAGDPQAALKALGDAAERYDRLIAGQVALGSRRGALERSRFDLSVTALLASGAVHAEGEARAEWVREALDHVLRRKALVQRSLAHRRARVRAQDASPEVQEAWERLVRAREALAVLWVSRQTGLESREEASFEGRLESAREAVTRAERELAASGGDAGLAPPPEVAAGLEELQAALAPGAALVDIERVHLAEPGQPLHDLHDVLLWVTRDGAGAIDLGQDEPLDEAIAAWRTALAASAARVRRGARDPAMLAGATRAGERLRALTWDRLPAEVRTASGLFVSPDHNHHDVHWPALPAAEGGYLAERMPPVQYLSSPIELLAPRGGDPPETALAGLVVGAPGRRAESAVAALRSGVDRDSLGRLSEVEAEAATVGEQLDGRGAVRTLIGTAGLESAFKRLAPTARVLHVAAHGYWEGMEDGGAGAEDAGAVPSRLWAGMLGSGLVLEPRPGPAAEGGADDGVLLAEELLALDLRGVELASMLACRTGEGVTFSREGVLGLRGALELAGARRSLLALWPLSDRQARAFSESFYGRWLAGTDPARAVRGTELELLDELRRAERPDHPYLWSGVILTGAP